MGMTITEKIFAAATGQTVVQADQIVTADIDLAMINDMGGPIVFKEFRPLGIPICHPEKTLLAIDHNVLPNTVRNEKTVNEARKFANDYGIEHFYDMQGIAHQLVCESGLLLPGQVAVGTDSHTCMYGALGAFSTGIGSTEMCAVLAEGRLWFRVPRTIRVEVTGKLPPHVMSKDIILKLLAEIGPNGATYQALEFTGDTIEALSMDARFTLCNMAVEAGAKSGIIAQDATTEKYLRSLGAKGPFTMYRSDPDAGYVRTVTIDAQKLEPMVAVPFSPANGVPVREQEGIRVDQVIIGACTNGRVEDLAAAAAIIAGHKIPRNVRCYVVPATNRIYAEASRKGYLAAFAEAGCIVVNAGCGGCGFQMPMEEGEVCVSTNNRNFCGRMGSPDSKVYVVSPETAAVTALTGRLTDPRA